MRVWEIAKNMMMEGSYYSQENYCRSSMLQAMGYRVDTLNSKLRDEMHMCMTGTCISKCGKCGLEDMKTFIPILFK